MAIGQRGCRALAGRLAKLEARLAPPKPVRLVVRYEGCDWGDPEEAKDEIDENDPNAFVLNVRYVETPLRNLGK